MPKIQVPQALLTAISHLKGEFAAFAVMLDSISAHISAEEFIPQDEISGAAHALAAIEDRQNIIASLSADAGLIYPKAGSMDQLIRDAEAVLRSLQRQDAADAFLSLISPVERLQALLAACQEDLRNALATPSEDGGYLLPYVAFVETLKGGDPLSKLVNSRVMSGTIPDDLIAAAMFDGSNAFQDREAGHGKTEMRTADLDTVVPDTVPAEEMLPSIDELPFTDDEYGLEPDDVLSFDDDGDMDTGAEPADDLDGCGENIDDIYAGIYNDMEEAGVFSLLSLPVDKKSGRRSGDANVNVKKYLKEVGPNKLILRIAAYIGFIPAFFSRFSDEAYGRLLQASEEMLNKGILDKYTVYLTVPRSSLDIYIISPRSEYALKRRSILKAYDINGKEVMRNDMQDPMALTKTLMSHALSAEFRRRGAHDFSTNDRFEGVTFCFATLSDHSTAVGLCVYSPVRDEFSDLLDVYLAYTEKDDTKETLVMGVTSEATEFLVNSIRGLHDMMAIPTDMVRGLSLEDSLKTVCMPSGPDDGGNGPAPEDDSHDGNDDVPGDDVPGDDVPGDYVPAPEDDSPAGDRERQTHAEHNQASFEGTEAPDGPTEAPPLPEADAEEQPVQVIPSECPAITLSSAGTASLIDAETPDINPVPAILDAKVLDQCISYLAAGSAYCATALLRAMTQDNAAYAPIYAKVAYAVNDPAAFCEYTSSKIMSVYFDESDELTDLLAASAYLRMLFAAGSSADFGLKQLSDMVRSIELPSSVREAAYILLQFKERFLYGADRYAYYHRPDKAERDKRLASIRQEARSQLDNRFNGRARENCPHIRVLKTKRAIFSPQSDLAECLRVVAANDVEFLDYVEDYIRTNFMSSHDAPVTPDSISPQAMEAYIDGKWAQATDGVLALKKTSDLMGGLRSNLSSQLFRVLSVITSWTELVRGSDGTSSEAEEYYKGIRGRLIGALTAAEADVLDYIQSGAVDSPRAIAGYAVLARTLKEIREKNEDTGTRADVWDWDHLPFYAPFLIDGEVILSDDLLPATGSMPDGIPVSCSPAARIARHFEHVSALDRTSPDSLRDAYASRMKDILDGGDDYGSVRLLATSGLVDVDEDVLERSVAIAGRASQRTLTDFTENVELAHSFGQLTDRAEDCRERYIQAARDWQAWAEETGNYGFFRDQVIEGFRAQIREDSEARGKTLLAELDGFLQHLPDSDDRQARVDRIRGFIASGNYIVAEDLMNRLASGEAEMDTASTLPHDYLKDFLAGYDSLYSNNSPGQALLTTGMKNRLSTKARKPVDRMLRSWIPNGRPISIEAMKDLLDCLGFQVASVTAPVAGNHRHTYDVQLQPLPNLRRTNFKTPIAMFGSIAIAAGLRVVTLYGSYTADSLYATYHDIGISIPGRPTLVLLDYPLPLSERCRLARLVHDNTFPATFGLIDRVLMRYLMSDYEPTSISKKLMSVMVPYTYVQPFCESADMPPEMFIGRDQELAKITAPDNNLAIVTGGRQLGKSALLRKAKDDIDGDPSGSRAVLVDIKGLGIEKSCLALSQALCDAGILSGCETEDWFVLARALTIRLQSGEPSIPYLLVLLDEADSFLAECGAHDYFPIERLKSVQGVGRGRFKFVMAGLRDVIRFNAAAALGNNSVLAHLSSMTIKPFSGKEARELLEVPVSYLGLRFSDVDGDSSHGDSLLSLILSSANYFPGLIQLYGRVLVEAMGRSGDYAGYDAANTPPYYVSDSHIRKAIATEIFQKSVREKMMITLRVGDDDYYWIIGLIIAYLYRNVTDRTGFTAETVLDCAQSLDIKKLSSLTTENIAALCEEMRELNVLRRVNDGYLFSRSSFLQLMGTETEVEEELYKYMEE